MFTLFIGDNSLGVLDIVSKQMIVHQDFFEDSTVEVSPIAVAINVQREKLLGLYLQNQKLMLTYKDIRANVIKKKATQKLYGSESSFYPSCMAKTMDEESVFLGGSDSKDSRMGRAIMVLLNFNDKLNPIRSLELSVQNQKLMTVSCLKRCPSQDLFLAGTYKHVFFIYWDGISLSVTSVFDNLHNRRIVLTRYGERDLGR